MRRGIWKDWRQTGISRCELCTLAPKALFPNCYSLSPIQKAFKKSLKDCLVANALLKSGWVMRILISSMG